MSRLIEATERLEAEINRLDRAVTHSLEVSKNDSEKQGLEQKLQAAKVECERLKAESAQVAGRLGTSIRHFQEILDAK